MQQNQATHIPSIFT